MGGIFINYRGADSQTAAALIDRELTAQFGSDLVFLDSRSIPAGSDFVEELLGRVRACSVLLVVIGPRWLTLTNGAGQRRIDDPQDWLRREVVEAFTHGLRVIPVLTGDVGLPAEAELPDDIAGLSRRQYVPLRRRYTDVDLAFLVKRIIDADPELAKVAAERHSATEQVPHQLPAAVAHFAGRAAELATLTGLLRDRADTGGTVVISAIGGTAGVGKTTLAIYWAHQVSDRFPDGQLYVNLRGFDPSGSVMDPAEAVRRFLDALRVPPEQIPIDLDAQAALYRSQLAGKRMLIVLDNARDTAQVRPLLPGAPTCLVLVTSRNQLTSLIATGGAHPITLDLPTPDEAQQLLAGRLGISRVAAELAPVEEIITRCARLPLAIALVAARAAVRPHGGLHTLADELRDSQQRWETLTGDDPTNDVQAVFSWSYNTLTPPAARMFRLLGMHPGPDLAGPAAASLAGVPATMVRPLLAELTRASLLVEHIPGRYTFHDLLRAYAMDLFQRIDSGPQRHAATERILDHYLQRAHAATRLLNSDGGPAHPHRSPARGHSEHLADDQQALRWFTTEHPVLLAAVNLAASAGFDSHAWQLARALGTFLYRRGHWHDWAAIGRDAVTAAQRLGDPPTQARAHRFLSGAYTLLGHLDDAQIQLSRALDLAIQTGDLIGQADAHGRLAYVWGQRGNLRQALDCARQALDLYQAADHKAGQARALSGIGLSHALLGDGQQALAYCQQALTLYQDVGSRSEQAAAWDGFGFVHQNLGHYGKAVTCYQHALGLIRDLGDRYFEAVTLARLGDTHHATANLQAARDAWQQSLTIFHDLRHSNADKLRIKLATLDAHPNRPATEQAAIPQVEMPIMAANWSVTTSYDSYGA
jgi:tetratricopeptide (TPR) repeat protein